jgi:signal transduction histidine kinase
MDPKIDARLNPGTDYHPMQVIPMFRRWQPSTLRNLLLTAILSAVIVVMIAACIAAFGGHLTWKRIYDISVFTLAIAYTQHYLYKFFITMARRREHWARWVMHPLFLRLVLPVTGIYVGFVVAGWILSGGLFFRVGDGWREFVFAACIAIAVGWALWESVEANRLREIERRERAELEAAAARTDKERATAELKTLRAQVEPHFLYNTLSNVVSLIDRDPKNAKHMTERLIGYLRHTLDASRRDHALVGDELSIIADYLEILRLRMGERLSFSIDADDAVRALPLAPMLLQPLVENAIKHGLEPKIEGGTIRVVATRNGDTLDITVEDSGLGFGAVTDTAGSGSGLANARARIAAIYGSSARLIIEAPAVGTRIRLRLPLVTFPENGVNSFMAPATDGSCN